MTMMGRKQHTAAALALIAVASSMPSAVAFSASQRLLSPTSNTYRYRASTSIFAESTPSSSSPDKLYATKTIEEGSHDELMYTLGVNLARQLGDVRPLVETSEELTHLARGLLDAIVGKLDDAEQMKLLARRGEDLNNIILERANAIRQKIEAAGRAMLNDMAENPETVTLECGVVLHPLEAGPDGFGKGVKPTAASTVKVHYHGTLPDGTVFDSSLGGDPVSFPLKGVIAGWREGLQRMCEGETAMLGIPPEMAYGEAGTPDGRIPGGAALFFKIQLIEVLSAGVGGGPKLVGADGKVLTKDRGGGTLLGADGKPL